MSDTFFAAAITANALFLSFGGILVTNVTKSIIELERNAEEVRRNRLRFRRRLVASGIVPTFLITLYVLITSLLALASPNLDNGLVEGVVLVLTVVNGLALCLEIAGALVFLGSMPD